jgi:hypothetical protein
MTTVIQALSSAISRAHYPGCDNAIEYLVNEYLPHGSGLDGMVCVDLTRSKSNKIFIDVEYHHMNEVGMYDGWTNHSIVVTPTFFGVDIRVTGKDRNSIKEYLADLFHSALMDEVR